MKALSIKQPWAHAILHLGKDVENRVWKTNFRGEFLVHSSANPCNVNQLSELVARRLCDVSAPKKIKPKEIETALRRLSYGCVLGKVELVDCVKGSPSDWAEEGMNHFVLRNPVVFTNAIPYKGKLNFFKVDGLMDHNDEKYDYFKEPCFTNYLNKKLDEDTVSNICNKGVYQCCLCNFVYARAEIARDSWEDEDNLLCFTCGADRDYLVKLNTPQLEEIILHKQLC